MTHSLLSTPKLFLPIAIVLIFALSGCGSNECNLARAEETVAYEAMEQAAFNWDSVRESVRAERKKPVLRLDCVNPETFGLIRDQSKCRKYYLTGYASNTLLERELSSLTKFKEAILHHSIIISTYMKCFDPKIVIKAKESAKDASQFRDVKLENWDTD